MFLARLEAGNAVASFAVEFISFSFGTPGQIEKSCDERIFENTEQTEITKETEKEANGSSVRSVISVCSVFFFYSSGKLLLLFHSFDNKIGNQAVNRTAEVENFLDQTGTDITVFF